MSVQRQEFEDGVEGGGDSEGEEEDEEGGGEDLEVDELFGGAETGVEGADVGLVC